MRRPVQASILLLACPALTICGCGGSRNSQQPSSASRSAGDGQAPSAAAVAAARASKRNVIATSHAPVQARDPEGMPDDEVNPTGAKVIDPCALVSRTQAQAILHGPIAAPVSAPQGPTCIYKPSGGRSSLGAVTGGRSSLGAVTGGRSSLGAVTLALRGRAFSTIPRSGRLRHRITVRVAGHAAFCGVAGAPTLVLPLPQGRLLVVTAPCPVAASFAARALPRIPRAAP